MQTVIAIIVSLYIYGVALAALIHRYNLEEDFLEKGNIYPSWHIWDYIIMNPPKELFYSWVTVVRQVIYKLKKKD